MNYSDIIKRIDKAVLKFNKNIPDAQRSMFDAVMEEVGKLDRNGDSIKATVANIRRVAAIKNKLNRLILTPEYLAEVKDFARAFNEVTVLQNQYWRQVEAQWKPRVLLKEIRKQAIGDVVTNLTESGIDANVAKPISDILKTNITTGGSVKQLTEQLRESLLNTESAGTLDRFAKTITTTSLNQYSAQYTNTVASDLGLEWYRYANSLLRTSRAFCKAMRKPENQWFHISMIPALLRAEGLTYKNEDGEEVPVPVNAKTGLPDGFIKGTNAANFLINRAGWNCGHQVQPVSEGLVPKNIRDTIMRRPDYQAWTRVNKKQKDAS